MANQAEVTEWFLRNSQSLGLKARHYTWPKQYLPQYSDLSVSIEVDGVQFVGRSMSLSVEESFLKAGVEAVERAAFAQAKLTSSNGIAAHSTKELARCGALRELIERDRLISHVVCGVPFYLINDRELELPLCVYQFSEQLKHLGIDLIFREMRKLGPYRSVVCSAIGVRFDRPFGIMAGFGCHRNLNLAAASAFCECVRHLIPVIEGREPVLSFAEFESQATVGPAEHQALFLNSSYAEEFMPLFYGALGADENSIQNFNEPSVEYTELPVAIQDVDLPPFIRVIRATCGSLQELYFGTPTIDALNIESLSNFLGERCDVSALMLRPHFLS